MARKAGVTHTIGWKKDGGTETKAGCRGLDESGATGRFVDTKQSGDTADQSVAAGVTGGVKAEALDSALIAKLRTDNLQKGTLYVYDLAVSSTVAVRTYHGKLKCAGGPRAGHTDVITLPFEVVLDTVPDHTPGFNWS